VWAQPTLIAKAPVNNILQIESYSIKAIPNDSGAFINYSIDYIGGGPAISFNRINQNGVLKWASPISTTLPGNVFYTYPGLNNTFYSLSRSNSLGSGIYIQKFDLNCAPQWTAAKDITLGVSTNGYGGGYHNILADNAGNIYVVWETTSNRIYYTKLDGNGNFVWTPQIKATVSLASTQQKRPDAIFYNNHLFITWNDNRIANQTTVFTQKFNASGTEQWTTNGVQTGIGDYINAFPKIAVSDSNSIFVTYLSGNPYIVRAQRIKSNGTLTWSGNGKTLASAYSYVNDNNIVATSDTNGCNAVFWIEYISNDIYGAKICSNGVLVSINEPEEDPLGFDIYPNPAQGLFNVIFKENTGLNIIEIFDIQGKLITQTNNENKNRISIDVSEFKKGLYLVKVKSENSFGVKKIHIL
jgi:hypothetical protein